MLIHKYGGVYTDMDTECYQPAQRWTPSGCHFAVALEDNDGFFCQWAFAAVPGHGALGSVLDLVLRKMINRAYKCALLAAAVYTPVDTTAMHTFTVVPRVSMPAHAPLTPLRHLRRQAVLHRVSVL